MTPQVKERAFDPFFTTKKAGEGSGMGLAVVAGIVRDYGGAISFTSEEGQGSTFTIYLLRVTAAHPATDPPLDGPPRGSERILLIDDELVQVRSVRSMLTRLGYEVVAMTDGQEALDRFRADPRAFDLVITDQTMPQMTGMRLSEEVLRLRPDLPIILCTGYSETVDAAGARALGIREFMMKPYSVREMAETVRRALGTNRT
jgi:CheY-like chemotaxis protein